MGQEVSGWINNKGWHGQWQRPAIILGIHTSGLKTACAEETEKTDHRIHSFLAAGTSQKKKKSNYVLRDGQGKRELGRYKLFARLQNKELKMEARFWPSIGRSSSNRREEKQQ